uniref:AlNc14C1929G13104 protein n=1 Tax=Albugo laibachii Nc14 TaxID=890382 RepID=F0X2V3_9STRA|nr:AlNc14C1929G13104 [Albugo laibachii Nc14]|eukprot:CCA28271.1 AlNc14C1929G13104 [Albugo laibachii Nc14]
MKTTLSGWTSGNGSRPTSPEAHGIETPCLDAYNVHHPVNSVKKWSTKAPDGTRNCANLAELIVVDAIAISELEPTKSLKGKCCTPHLVVKVDNSMRNTRKLLSTQASKFEEHFVFLSMPRPDSHDKELMSVTVMDENSAESDKQIGQVYIDLCVAQDESFAGWYTLTNVDHTHCGSVYIVFRRLPIRTAEALTAAKKLASLDRSLSSTDREDYHSILPDVWPSNTDHLAFHDEDQASTSSPSGPSSWPLDGLKRRLTWGRSGDIEARSDQSRRNIF